MEPIFRQTYTVSSMHVDCMGQLKPSVALYFAQEAATGHCKELQVDWATLSQRHLFWAVIRNRMQVSRLPSLGETITLETWPMPTTRSAYPRATAAYDSQGNVLFRVISLWVLMDSESRAMVLPGKSGVNVAGTLRGTELAAPGSIVPKPLINTTVRQVGYTELDRNFHMNNTYYLNWIDDLLPSAFHREHPVREITVCYLSEAREGQEITMNWQLLEEGCLQVDAHRQSTLVHDRKERVFSAQLLF